MPVDCVPGDAELRSDLSDGVGACLPSSLVSSYMALVSLTWRGPILGFCMPVRPPGAAAWVRSQLSSAIGDDKLILLADAQTSGGLLLAQLLIALLDRAHLLGQPYLRHHRLAEHHDHRPAREHHHLELGRA